MPFQTQRLPVTPERSSVAPDAGCPAVAAEAAGRARTDAGLGYPAKKAEPRPGDAVTVEGRRVPGHRVL